MVEANAPCQVRAKETPGAHPQSQGAFEATARCEGKRCAADTFRKVETPGQATGSFMLFRQRCTNSGIVTARWTGWDGAG
jgi:hypothetical protein